MGAREEKRKALRGDFNARIGGEGGRVEEEEMEGIENGERQSKDGKMNEEGRKLVAFVEEKGWSLFNGNIKGDENGEFIFIGGKGNTVIDYVMRSEEVRERLAKMRVEDKMESDHHPLEVRIENEGKRSDREGMGERSMESGRA